MGARDRQGRLDLVAVSRFDQPLRRTADAKRCERREEYFGTDPVRTERGSHRGREIGHEWRSSTAISTRSCAMSAFIASASVQTANAMVSFGASCPATAMSAAMTVAIFG